MSDDLRTNLQQLADEAAPLPVADDLWQRGRAARRRGQALAITSVLALIVCIGGIATLTLGGGREAQVAGETVEGGAIPSRIVDPPITDPPLERDLAIGPASVAFVPTIRTRITPFATVIGATDGRYHFLDLPGLDQDRDALALSPDGTRLAWRSEQPDLHVTDLTTGKTTDLVPNEEPRAYNWTLQWRADSTHLTWAGNPPDGGIINVTTGEEVPASPRDSFTFGAVSPDGRLAAVPSRNGPDAKFTMRDGKQLRRALPADLYPRGADVEPLGWADRSRVLARVHAPRGSTVEGSQLALFTSPDRPESEWTYRIVQRDVPDVPDFEVAVDLIPDLDGTSSQQFTHDFGDPDFGTPWWRADVSLLIGLGVAAVLSVLSLLGWLWRRLRP